MPLTKAQKPKPGKKKSLTNKDVKRIIKDVKSLKKYSKSKVGTPNEELAKFNRGRGKEFQKRTRGR
jgi:hypothetical protein